MNIIGINGHSLQNNNFLKDQKIITITDSSIIMDIILSYRETIESFIRLTYGSSFMKRETASVMILLNTKEFTHKTVSALWTLEIVGKLLKLEDQPGYLLIQHLNNIIFEYIKPYNTLGSLDTNIIDYVSEKVFYDFSFNDYLPRNIIEKSKINLAENDFTILRDNQSTIVNLIFSRGCCQLNLNFDAFNANYFGQKSIINALGFTTGIMLYSHIYAEMGAPVINSSGKINFLNDMFATFQIKLLMNSDMETNLNDENDEDFFEEELNTLSSDSHITYIIAFSTRYEENEIVSGIPMLDMSMPESYLQVN